MAASNDSPPTDVRVEVPDAHEPDALFEACEAAQSLFRAGLAGDEGAGAREHLYEERGLPAALVEEEGIGYVGRGDRTVTTYLADGGIDLEAAAEAGLLYRSRWDAMKAFKRDRGRWPESTEELTGYFADELAGDAQYYFDYPLCHTADGERKSGYWLTLPIRVLDEEGEPRIAGFQYRSMRPAAQIGKRGRYMSPINTHVLSWSDTLIGLAEERDRIDRIDRAVLTEGKFDQLAVKAALAEALGDDRPAVIALGGASTRGNVHSGDTPAERAGVLAGIDAAHVTLFLDSDERGTEAVLEAGPLLADLDTHVRVARVEDGLESGDDLVPGGDGDDPAVGDPGELLEVGGTEAVLRALRGARSRGLVSFASDLMERRLANHPRSGQLRQRLEALDALVPIVRTLPEAVQGAAEQRAAEAVQLDRRVVELAVASERERARSWRAARSARKALAQHR